MTDDTTLISDGQTKQYVVTWEIDAEGSTPRAAAEQALAVQRDRGSSAVYFRVTPADDPDAGENVDLYEDPEDTMNASTGTIVERAQRAADALADEEDERYFQVTLSETQHALIEVALRGLQAGDAESEDDNACALAAFLGTTEEIR